MLESLLITGAEGRTRTGTYGNTLDFESSASANSATSATKKIMCPLTGQVI